MNKVNFLNIELEYNEKVFRPTLLSEKCALNTNFKDKNILDLGCGIGPLAIYFAKNGASSVDAIDIYNEHLELSRKNAVLTLCFFWVVLMPKIKTLFYKHIG